VREKAADVLRQARTPEALSALTASLKQSDARVRNAVVKAIGGWFTPAAGEALQKIVASEKNPAIVATALRALAPYQTPAVRELLARSLGKESYRERLAEGAINAIKAQDDPALLPVLMGSINGRLSKIHAGPLPAALETAGMLARNEQNKNEVRELLLGHLDHPREAVRVAAISGLGNLEDPRAIAALETFSGASAFKPEKSSAEKALEKIRAARKPSEELKGLRTEVTELQKSAGDLKKELETLKKKLETQKP
jgi:HEAT repeat protein